MRFLTMLGLATAIFASSALFSAAEAVNRVFSEPRFLGHRVDHCATWGTNCGRPGADQFCQRKGFPRSVSFQMRQGVASEADPAIVIGGSTTTNRRLCNAPGCGVLTQVVCQRADVPGETCFSALPPEFLIGILQTELNALQPQLVLDQTGPRRGCGRGCVTLYKPGGNFIRMRTGRTSPGEAPGFERFPLTDFEPETRERRSYYVNDVVSNAWRVTRVPASKNYYGLRLKIYFETEGNEIKGFCRTCRTGDRDGRAADGNMTGRDEARPFFALDFAVSIVGNFIEIELQESEFNAGIDMNGFAEWFERRIRREVRDQIRDNLMARWDGQLAPLLRARVRAGLSAAAAPDGMVGRPVTEVSMTAPRRVTACFGR